MGNKIRTRSLFDKEKVGMHTILGLPTGGCHCTLERQRAHIQFQKPQIWGPSFHRAHNWTDLDHPNNWLKMENHSWYPENARMDPVI